MEKFGGYEKRKSEEIDASGLTKAKVLKALFDFAQPPPEYHLYRGSRLALWRAADEVIRRERTTSANKFGEVLGRHLHVDLSNTTFDVSEYNEINGEYTAQAAIDVLRMEDARHQGKIPVRTDQNEYGVFNYRTGKVE